MERKTRMVENQKNDIYHLIGFYSVFQGVILTAVKESNLLHPNSLGSSIARLLSLSVSIVAIAGVAQKLKIILALQKTIYSEEQALKDLAHRGQGLRREGKDFAFAKFSESKKNGSKMGYSMWCSVWYAVGVISLLAASAVAFSLVIEFF